MQKTYAIIDADETNLTDDLLQAKEWLSQSKDGCLYRKICTKTMRYWGLKAFHSVRSNEKVGPGEWIAVGMAHTRIDFKGGCISKKCEMFESIIVEITENEFNASLILGITIA